MLLHFCPVGVTLSWEEAHPGARASRPHKSSRSFSHLLHRNQPAAAPCLCFGRAHAVPAGRAVGCNIAGKLSGNRRDSMRAGRPRSQAMPSRRCGGECLAGDFSESRPAPFGKLPFARKSSPRPSRRGGSYESETGFVSGKRCGLALLGRWLHAAAYCESQGGASVGRLA